MKKFQIAVSTRCTEYHSVVAPNPRAALAAYHADMTVLDDDQVDAIDGVRVIDPETHADLTLVAQGGMVQ